MRYSGYRTNYDFLDDLDAHPDNDDDGPHGLAGRGLFDGIFDHAPGSVLAHLMDRFGAGPKAARADRDSNDHYAGRSAVEPEPTPSHAAALLAGDAYRWNYGGPMGTAVTLDYAFLASVPSYYGSGATERNGFTAFNAQQQQAAEQVLDCIAQVCNVSFVESGAAEAEITFGNAALGSGVGAWAYYPSSYYSLGGDVWVNNQYGYNLSPAEGNYAFMSLLHETGHALGLSHPDTSTLPSGEDNRQYTAMSYNKHPDMGPVEPQTMMLYDIAALQELYGANMTHNAGDTVYNLSGAQDLVETIWDAGGHDTLDASGDSLDVRLDLRDGHFSSVGTRGDDAAADNVAIAFDTAIEDAVGGGGDDVLIGNEAANELFGGAGDDSLTGGGGADTFAFSGNWGADSVADFEDGVDQVCFVDPGMSFDDLMISYGDGNATVGAGNGTDTINLANVDAYSLAEDDFLFA